METSNSITGGTVAIEDGLKAKEEYAPARKVKVELSFSVPEGGNSRAFLDGVAAVAEGKLNELLGRKVTPATTTADFTPAPETPKAETAAQKKAREKKEAAAVEAAKPQRTKADLEREAGLPVTGKSDDELLADDEPEINAAGKPVEEDELGDLLGDAAPVPITDVELGKAAQEKNAKMKAAHGEKWAPAKIRDLIAKASDNKRINDIPAAARAKFLKDLEALKP